MYCSLSPSGGGAGRGDKLSPVPLAVIAAARNEVQVVAAIPALQSLGHEVQDKSGALRMAVMRVLGDCDLPLIRKRRE